MHSRVGQAHRMLDVFTSVSAEHFDASRIGMDGKLVAFRPDLDAGELKRILPATLKSADEAKDSIVIRPRGPGLIQLDDLASAKLHRVAPFAFMIVQTSPGNHQAWVAVQGSTPDIARRLRQCIGADQNASGSVRLAGSRNFKAKYAPDYPTISVVDSAPGRIIDMEQIQPHLAPEPTWVERATSMRPKRWPEYKRILDGAPPNQANSGPDISRADYLFARMAAQAQHAPDEIAARLMQISPKAKREGERYARRTAESAASAIR